MRNLIVKFFSKHFNNFIVDILREKAKQTTNTIDDRLVEQVADAMEGKTPRDMVKSAKKEVKRVKAKVKSLTK